MSDTLRDQLLGLGFKPAPKPERKPERKPEPHKPEQRKPAPGGKHKSGKPQEKSKPQVTIKPSRPRENFDLAKAYAIRAQKEKDERIEAERQKQEEARQRREAKAKLETLLQGKSLNAADAEHVRHFPYGGKIKRVHVTEAQLKALNAGELGVVQLNGRYLLVDAATLLEVEALFPPAIALKVDPNAPVENDPYADPQYQVPDDLVW
jgi:uncharacterized protein YaiL (DUF2058 family)